MGNKKQLALIVAGLFIPMLAQPAQTELLLRYQQINEQLATADESLRNDLLKEKEQIQLALAGTKPAETLPRVSEKTKDDAATAVGAEEQLDAATADYDLLASKLDTIFKSFIVPSYLDGHATVLAETLERSFRLQLEKLSSLEQDLETASKVKAEIIVFVETARLLFCKMQLLSVSPAVASTLFGLLPLTMVDKQRLHDLFVKALYALTFDDNQWQQVVGYAAAEKTLAVMINQARWYSMTLLSMKPLIEVLWNEGVIEHKYHFSWCGYRRSLSGVSEVFNTQFDSQLIDLMQQVLDLEKDIDAIPTLKSLQQTSFVKKTIKNADELMGALLQKYAQLHKNGHLAAPWAKLFVGKTVLLKRAMLVRIQVVRAGQDEKLRREIYVKHDLLMQDPLLTEVSTKSNLRGYASRYEAIVMRFLMGQTSPAIDFYHDQQMLLSHLRALVIKITPQGWRQYVYEIKGDGVYAPVFQNMIEVLELIDKAVHNDDSFFGAAQNVINSLLGEKGLLAGLGNKEIQAAVSKIGLNAEQLKAALSSKDPKETVMRILAHASPLLVTTILQYVRGDKSTTKEEVKTASPQLVSSVPVAASSLEALLHAQPTLLHQLEEKAPGLTDLLARHIQQALEVPSV